MALIESSHLRTLYDQLKYDVLDRHTDYVSAALIGCATAVGVAALYLLASGPSYTAQAQLLIDPAIPTLLQEQSNEPSRIMDSQQVESDLAVLRSEQVASAVITRFKLGQRSELRGYSLSDYLPFFSRLGADANEIDQTVLNNFRKNLTVRRIGISYAVDIQYASADADRAAQIANGIAEEYMRFQLESRANAAKVGSQWLEKRLSELRTEMNAAARRMQEFRIGHDYSIARRKERLASVGKAPDTRTDGDGKFGLAPANASDEQVTIEELESTASTYRKIYENFLQAFAAAVQRQSFPISNARVITKAIRPLSPSRSAGLILLVAAIAGAALGIGLVYGKHRMDKATAANNAQR